MSERSLILSWLKAGLEAVEPERLTRQALMGHHQPLRVLAVGKAAPAMCRGAAAAVGSVEGLCVTTHRAPVPEGVELMIGDHPDPAPASLAAGHRALDLAPNADVALISGGGSSLCEIPAEGLTIDHLAEINHTLLASGISIFDLNLVRSHLSRIKGGGLGPIPTYLLSDVAGSGPEVVSSGPTIGVAPDPERVLRILERSGVEVDARLEEVVRRRRATPPAPSVIEVIGDGRMAAHGVAAAAGATMVSRVRDGWITGSYLENLIDFIGSAPPGVTIAAGEPSVPVGGTGRGGRNTHAALTAARMIAGTGVRFAALATDGVDGTADAAGAIVDGSTLERGGDPSQALANCDSASYLEETGELIETGPTGTNVADLWLIWKPESGSEPILTV